VLVRGWRSVFHDRGEPVALATGTNGVYVLDSNGIVWLLSETTKR
jgi:hypothetical protein